MMKALTATAILMAATSGAPAQAQQTAPSATAPAAPALDLPLLGVAQASPDCGNLSLSGRATCVTAPLAAMSDLGDTYIAHLESQGWLAADGDDNRVIFAKRRDGGGCDGLQMVAFYDTARAAAPEVPGYLGFALIPGDICAETPSQ